MHFHFAHFQAQARMETHSLVAVVLALLSVIASARDFYYVEPSANSYVPEICLSHPCLTVDQVSSYASTASTFIFLAGNHTLQGYIDLRGLSNVMLKGDESGLPVNILWSDDRLAIYCDTVHNIVIERLTLKPNGQNQRQAIELYDSTDILIANSLFEGRVGVSMKVRALSVLNSTVTITKCVFEGNGAAYIGGAIYAFRSSRISLVDTVLIHNEARYAGGALYASGGCSITMLNTTFSNNLAKIEFGGAICAENHTSLTINGSEFLSNFGRSGGGALRCETCVLIIEGVNFFESNSANVIDVSSSGGAIDISRESVASISGKVHYFNNSAVQGGAISVVGSVVNLLGHEVIFRVNVAFNLGGAIAVASSSGNINTTFINNSAVSSGGAVHVRNPRSDIHFQLSGMFIANSALTLCGGAIFVQNTLKFTFRDIHVTETQTVLSVATGANYFSPGHHT